MSDTPSLISVSVTPVPTPGTSAGFAPLADAVVEVDEDAPSFTVPLPHAAATSAKTTSPPIATIRARRCTAASPNANDRTLRERDELHEVVRPMVDGAVGHHEHTVGLELGHEFRVVAHQDHRTLPGAQGGTDRGAR